MGAEPCAKWIDRFELSSIQSNDERAAALRHETMKDETNMALCSGYRAVYMLGLLSEVVLKPSRKAVERSPDNQCAVVLKLIRPWNAVFVVVNRDVPSVGVCDDVEIPCGA